MRTSERDILEAVKLARNNEEYGAVAQTMATLELSRQQRAANLIAFASLLHARGCTEFEEKIVTGMLHTAADITGMRPDGSIEG